MVVVWVPEMDESVAIVDSSHTHKVVFVGKSENYEHTLV